MLGDDVVERRSEIVKRFRRQMAVFAAKVRLEGWKQLIIATSGRAGGTDVPPKDVTFQAIRIPRAAALYRRGFVIGLILSSFAAIVAGLSGTLLLYYPNLGWGSCEDALIAFLWGLGVTSVANATYLSASSILGRIGVGPPDPK